MAGAGGKDPCHHKVEQTLRAQMQTSAERFCGPVREETYPETKAVTVD